MDAKLFTNNPFFRPQWRADRVLQMLRHRPSPLRPRRQDDHYVRAYRRFLLSYIVAGDDEAQRAAAIGELPNVYQAHLLHHSPDPEWRDILQARILSGESCDDIAKRFATDSAVIDYYEKTFFNVRDRLKARDWIYKVALGPPPRIVGNENACLEKAQRGYMWRLFGYFGGPLVLDAMFNGGMSVSVPRRPQEAKPWLDDVLARIVKVRCVAAAHSIEPDRKSVMRLLKLAVRGSGAEKGRQAEADTSAEIDRRMEKMFKDIDSAISRPLSPALADVCAKCLGVCSAWK